MFLCKNILFTSLYSIKINVSSPIHVLFYNIIINKTLFFTFFVVFLFCSTKFFIHFPEGSNNFPFLMLLMLTLLTFFNNRFYLHWKKVSKTISNSFSKYDNKPFCRKCINKILVKCCLFFTLFYRHTLWY